MAVRRPGAAVRATADLARAVRIGRGARATEAVEEDVEIGLIEQAGHAFLLEDPHGVAGAIQAFLHECGDD